MSAYQLQKELERNRYTNIDPAKYYDKLNPILLGRRAYTAYDTSVTDEERNATDSYGNKTYYPSVTLRWTRKPMETSGLNSVKNTLNISRTLKLL